MGSRRRKPRWAVRSQTWVLGLALIGYVSVFSASPAGHGLRLLHHLAESHSGPSESHPGPSASSTPTKRVASDVRRKPDAGHMSAVHTHDGPPVAHGHGAADPDAHPGHAPTARDEHESGGEVHEHNGIAHTHRAPPPDPSVILMVSLDKHRLPDVLELPSPRPPHEVAPGSSSTSFLSAESSVETPPPIGCS